MYLIFREIPYMTDRVSEQRYFLKGVLCVADGAVILNRGEQNLLYIVKTYSASIVENVLQHVRCRQS